MCRLVLSSLAALLFGSPAYLVATAADSNVESRPITVRGETFSLTVSPDELVVRPPRAVKEVRVDPRTQRQQVVEKFLNAPALANTAFQAQARLTNVALPPDRAVAGKEVARFGHELGGIFIPRLPGVKSIQVAALLGNDQEPGTRVEPVFKYQDRRVVLLRSVTVRFAEAPKPADVASIAEDFQLEPHEGRALSGTVVRFSLKPEAPDAFTVTELLKTRPGVKWVDPGLAFEMRAFGMAQPGANPNDPHFPKQWYLGDQEPSALKIKSVWGALGNGTNTITVAVLDDGVDVDNPDLTGRVLPGHDFFENDNDPRPDFASAHGTACAGIIAAETNNGIGVAGIAPRARILPVRIAGESNFATDSAIADGILFAQEKGARILNCSWGGGPPSNFLIDAIDAVTDGGCLIVVSAGNAIPPMPVFFPARYERCLAVGAVRRTGLIWNYSCWGPGNEVDLVAPSGDVNLHGDIWTTDHGGSAGLQ